MRALSALLFVSLLLVACPEPQCPKGEHKKGSTCYPIVTPGDGDAGPDGSMPPSSCVVSGCEGNASCNQTTGKCEPCKSGFAVDAMGACVDADECALGMDDCPSGSRCDNTSGSFSCACPLGPEGDARKLDHCQQLAYEGTAVGGSVRELFVTDGLEHAAARTPVSTAYAGEVRAIGFAGTNQALYYISNRDAVDHFDLYLADSAHPGKVRNLSANLSYTPSKGTGYVVSNVQVNAARKWALFFVQDQLSPTSSSIYAVDISAATSSPRLVSKIPSTNAPTVIGATADLAFFRDSGAYFVKDLRSDAAPVAFGTFAGVDASLKIDRVVLPPSGSLVSFVTTSAGKNPILRAFDASAAKPVSELLVGGYGTESQFVGPFWVGGKPLMLVRYRSGTTPKEVIVQADISVIDGGSAASPKVVLTLETRKVSSPASDADWVANDIRADCGDGVLFSNQKLIAPAGYQPMITTLRGPGPVLTKTELLTTNSLLANGSPIYIGGVHASRDCSLVAYHDNSTSLLIGTPQRTGGAGVTNTTYAIQIQVDAEGQYSYFSNDGVGLFAVTSAGGSAAQVLDTSWSIHDYLVASTQHECACAGHQSGDRYVYVLASKASESDQLLRIRRRGSTWSQPELVTSASDPLTETRGSPSLSADGSTLAYLTNHDGGPFAQLTVPGVGRIDVDSKAQESAVRTLWPRPGTRELWVIGDYRFHAAAEPYSVDLSKDARATPLFSSFTAADSLVGFENQTAAAFSSDAHWFVYSQARGSYSNGVFLMGRGAGPTPSGTRTLQWLDVQTKQVQSSAPLPYTQSVLSMRALAPGYAAQVTLSGSLTFASTLTLTSLTDGTETKRALMSSQPSTAPILSSPHFTTSFDERYVIPLEPRSELLAIDLKGALAVSRISAAAQSGVSFTGVWPAAHSNHVLYGDSTSAASLYLTTLGSQAQVVPVSIQAKLAPAAFVPAVAPLFSPDGKKAYVVARFDENAVQTDAVYAITLNASATVVPAHPDLPMGTQIRSLTLVGSKLVLLTEHATTSSFMTVDLADASADPSSLVKLMQTAPSMVTALPDGSGILYALDKLYVAKFDKPDAPTSISAAVSKLGPLSVDPTRKRFVFFAELSGVAGLHVFDVSKPDQLLTLPASHSVAVPSGGPLVWVP